eukprot:scaffold19505_cov131-Amphora_coffeaeformis.AAC.1
MAREGGEELGRGKGCSGPTRCRRRWLSPSTSTGEAIEGGKGLGGRWVWGRVSTASTTVSTVAYGRGSSAGVGWVKTMEKG